MDLVMSDRPHLLAKKEAAQCRSFLDPWTSMHLDDMQSVRAENDFVVSLGPRETVTGYIQSQGHDSS